MKWWWLSVVAVSAACAPSNGVEVLAVDFGVVALGATHEAPLRVRNGTRFEAKFVRVEQRSGPRGFTVLPGFGPVAAGGQATWAVRYEALQPGPVEAAFAIVFERGESEVVVRARGAERCEVPGIFFGEVRPGVTRQRGANDTIIGDRSAGDAHDAIAFVVSGQESAAADTGKHQHRARTVGEFAGVLAM